MDEMGLRIFTGPKLPVIPLGINSKEFVFSKNDKAKARNALKIDKNSVVIVYVGRLSFHAKANPLAMYAAIEKAANADGQHSRPSFCDGGFTSEDCVKRQSPPSQSCWQGSCGSGEESCSSSAVTCMPSRSSRLSSNDVSGILETKSRYKLSRLRLSSLYLDFVSRI